jgi:transcription-repair coupling factor (superfamily II helicase)
VAEVSALTIGDFVVHVDHGIGRYDGLVAIDVGGAAHDCLRVIYDGGDKLFVPVENIEVLSRYGSGDGEVALDKLGGAGWQARKARVKQRIRAIADELVRLAATRSAGGRVMPPEGLFDEFCATSPSRTGIAPRHLDVSGPRFGPPMDRRSAATSASARPVALRAASSPYGRVSNGGIVPTTARPPALPQLPAALAGLPVRIGASRLVTPKQGR